MAVPTITKTGTGSNKASGTLLSVNPSPTSHSTGDYVVMGLAMDPATGAVSFSHAGTATLSGWTTIGDYANGSGTSGVRTVLAYAKVTAGGTVTTVSASHPTAVARAGATFKVAGADGTTPVNCSATGDALAGGSFATVAPTSSGVDCTGLIFGGFECANGATTSFSAGGGGFVQDATSWTAGGIADTTSVGTSGSGDASNISCGAEADTKAPISASSILMYSGTPTGKTNAHVGAVFQAPAAAVHSLVFDERRVRRNHLLRR